MDLYGDLPPASGDAGEKAQQPVLGSSWSLPLNTSKKNTSSSGSASKAVKEALSNDQQSKVENVQTSSSGQAATTTKMTPSSVLFKPRQTATAVSRPQSSFSIKQIHSSRPEEGFRQPETKKTATESFVPNTATNFSNQNSHIAANKSVMDIEQEFNTNDSFDVIDPYDPRRPNDYLTLCQERKEEKRLQQLAVDNQKKIAENERLRAERDRERQEAAAKGDYLKLLQQEEQKSSNTSSSATGAASLGRGSGGRGRGLSNLPAWMTQQIAEQGITTTSAETAADAPPIITTNAAQQFQDANTSNSSKKKVSAITRPSTVLLLTNMVSIDEIDHDLEIETQRECEKFGPVKRCLIHIVKAASKDVKEDVRVFIQFMRQDAAVRAFK